jgi:hypothetical protein
MDVPFSEILQEAIDSGFRAGSKEKSWSGSVGRKLSILTRIRFANEFEEMNAFRILGTFYVKES